MVFDTLAMLSCTGSALVWLYCTQPKIAPMAQITIPRYINVTPLTPPRPGNVTCVRSGILMSASLAYTPLAAKSVRNPRTIQNQYLLFLIILEGRVLLNRSRLCQHNFRQNPPV